MKYKIIKLSELRKISSIFQGAGVPFTELMLCYYSQYSTIEIGSRVHINVEFYQV